MSVEELIDQYQRRIEESKKVYREAVSDYEKSRLATKDTCYRDFLSELKQVKGDCINQPDSNELALAFGKLNRLEVIDHAEGRGRILVDNQNGHTFTPSFQDEGRTLKIFVHKKT